MIVDLVLEGHLEEPVARKIVTYCGHEVGNCFGKRGCAYIKMNAYKYHSITKTGKAVFVLTDFMDSGCECIVEACQQYLTNYIKVPHKKFLLRFAVAELESWILADRIGLASFLGIHPNKIPSNPDYEFNPKQTLVNLARKSRKVTIKRAIVPKEGLGGTVGPDYRTAMQQFVENVWDIECAMANSPSLARCVKQTKSSL